MTSFFYIVKKMSFSGSPKGTPQDWCRRTMKKKTILQWKPMDLGGVPQKIDGYLHLVILIFSLGTCILCMWFCKDLGLFHV